MRRVIRKRIRRQEDGLDLALDLNVELAVNARQEQVRLRRSSVPEDERSGAGPVADRPDAAGGEHDPRRDT